MSVRPRDDEGSILPLTIFYGLLGLILVLMVVAASSLYLERKRLFTLADGAALAGAEAFDLDQVTAYRGALRVTLRSPDVADTVEEYVAGAPTADFDALRIAEAGTDDGESATVTLTAVWHPPLISPLVPAGVPIRVTSTARSVFW